MLVIITITDSGYKWVHKFNKKSRMNTLIQLKIFKKSENIPKIEKIPFFEFFFFLVSDHLVNL